MKKLCSVSGCSRALKARGVCHAHYEALRRAGAVPRRERTIAESFDDCWRAHPGPLETPCHLWIRGHNSQGRGTLQLDQKTLKAHRFAWERVHGPIPEGMCVLHRCDVRNCVNPDHLELGTQAKNIEDRDRKGRSGASRGAANATAFLSEVDVERIRDMWRVGGVTQAAIARLFEVSNSTVNAIIKRRLWAHAQ